MLRCWAEFHGTIVNHGNQIQNLKISTGQLLPREHSEDALKCVEKHAKTQ